MNLNFEQIVAFIAVYEHGSFALAALKEKKHASTLSKRVSNLELDLGFDLFERQASAVTPNQKAHELYQYAKAVQFEMEQFNYRTLNFLEEQPTELTLAIDSSTLGLKLTSAITEVSRHYPALDLKFIEGDTIKCVRQVKNGKADLAIVLSTEHYTLDFAVAKLRPFDVASVARPEYTQQFGIKSGDQISHHTRRQMRQIILQSFQDMGHSEVQKASHHYYPVNSFPCSLELIKHGLGWGNLPLPLCQHLIDSGELVEFQAEHEATYRWSSDAIWLASNPLSAPMELLIEKLKETSQGLSL